MHTNRPTSSRPPAPTRSPRSGLPESAKLTQSKAECAEIGRRLRCAREAKGITQAAAASAIGVARTTLVAIEQGRRTWRPSEIQRLAATYGTTANELLRDEAVHVNLAPRFRKLSGSGSDQAESAARLLADLVRAEVELENLLGIRRTLNYPAERAILPGDVQRQAETDASEFRQWLGLRQAPVRDVLSLLELDLGVRVYVRPIDSRISGLFAYDATVGACVLLNAKHPPARRARTAIHELAHLLSARHAPVVHYRHSRGTSREERYANAFARAFLTPRRAVAERLQALTAGSGTLTRRTVILLSHAFGVSLEAIVRRLEDLQLVHRGSWDWFQANGRITQEHVREVLGGLDQPEAQAPEAHGTTTLRLTALASEVYRKELLSEGQMASLLRLGRRELRQLLAHEAFGVDAGTPKSSV